MTTKRMATTESDDAAAGEPGPLLSMAEMAFHLRISRSKLYHLVWAGHLEPIRIGRRVLFTRASLDRLIEDLQR